MPKTWRPPPPPASRLSLPVPRQWQVTLSSSRPSTLAPLNGSISPTVGPFFGGRVGRVRDPLGNLWWIQTRIEDLGPHEMEQRLSAPAFTKAMEYVQSADFFPGGTS